MLAAFSTKPCEQLTGSLRQIGNLLHPVGAGEEHPIISLPTPRQVHARHRSACTWERAPTAQQTRLAA